MLSHLLAQLVQGFAMSGVVVFAVTLQGFFDNQHVAVTQLAQFGESYFLDFAFVDFEDVVELEITGAFEAHYGCGGDHISEALAQAGTADEQSSKDAHAKEQIRHEEDGPQGIVADFGLPGTQGYHAQGEQLFAGGLPVFEKLEEEVIQHEAKEGQEKEQNSHSPVSHYQAKYGEKEVGKQIVSQKEQQPVYHFSAKALAQRCQLVLYIHLLRGDELYGFHGLIFFC